MSWSYDINLTADKDRVRFLIRDVESTKKIFQDEEINGVLAFEPNIYQCSAVIIRARLPFYVDKIIAYTLGAEIRGALTFNRKGLIREALELCDSLERKAISVPEEFMDRLDFGIDRFGEDTSNYDGQSDVDVHFANWWNTP